MSDFTPPSMTPTGWFQVGWSEEFGTAQVRPLRYFGQDLVAYRSKAGNVVVLDAHCPHLGAHLGYGGRVDGEDLECPFHGWRWSPEGRNVCIPYQDRVSKTRRLRPWSTCERDGIVYLWHDEAGGDPQVEVPDLFGLFDRAGSPQRYRDPYPSGTLCRGEIRMHPQFVVENGVDFAHFKYVHRADTNPTIVDRQFDDWHFRTTMALSFSVRSRDERTPRVIEGGVQAHILGVGLSYAYTWGTGDVCSLTAATPVDDVHTELRFTAWVADDDGSDDAAVERRQRSAIQQVLADLNIWEHQRYTEPPVLATSEADGFRAMRRWATRFYPPPSPEQAAPAEADQVGAR